MKLKISLFLLFIPLASSNLLENLQILPKIGNGILNGLKNVGNVLRIKSNDVKSKGKIILDLGKGIYGFMEDNKENIEKIKEIIPDFNKTDVLNGVIYLDKYFIKENQKTIFNDYISYVIQTRLIPENIGNPIIEYKWIKHLTNLFKNANNIESVLKSMKIVGNVGSAVFTFKDKISKCKNKDKNAYFIASAQTAANTGTNFAFSTIGSALGTFIPIPILGTFIGGAFGSYIGNKINSLYDFGC